MHIFINVNRQAVTKYQFSQFLGWKNNFNSPLKPILFFLKGSGKGTQICGIPQYGSGVPDRWKWVLKILIPGKPAGGFHCRGKVGQSPDVLLP